MRVDVDLGEGGEILANYDSMIAKLITWGRDREEAIARMRRALADYEIGGVPTTIPFHTRVMEHPAFIGGEATTTFLVDHPEVLELPAPVTPGSGSSTDGEEPRTQMVVEVNGRRFEVAISGLAMNGNGTNRTRRKRPARPRGSAATGAAGNDLVSPIQGTVLRVAVEAGQSVTAGDLVCVVEAMKMENELTAHRDGVVTKVGVAPGGTVQIGAIVATIEDAQ